MAKLVHLCLLESFSVDSAAKLLWKKKRIKSFHNSLRRKKYIYKSRNRTSMEYELINILI